VFAYLPDALAALLILIAGMVLSRFLARTVLIGAVNLQLQNARLLAIGIKWLILIMAVAMALEHLHIGQQILLVAFAILFGGIVLAMALAIGLGSKDHVARSWLQMRNEAGEEDKLDHL
jgi:MFS-type transporter involved in bile tolerance (Atg22 family)